MLADLLPVLIIGAALVALPLLALRAMRRRQAYCGQSPKRCFWCDRHCEYYGLEEPEGRK